MLEIGFRGTVTEDAYGQRNAANWSSNLDAGAVPLQRPNGASAELLVHKGCLTCIFFSTVLYVTLLDPILKEH